MDGSTVGIGLAAVAGRPAGGGVGAPGTSAPGVVAAILAGCPIRNFLRARGSADRRTLNWLWTASGQEIHDNVRVPDEIQKDLRASEWLIRSIQ